MSVAGSQQQTVLRLLRSLQPYWHSDPALPARVQALFGRHKQFGSRDRRLYRELIYTAVRYLPWVEPYLESDPMLAVKRIAWLAAETRDTSALRRDAAGDWPAPGTLQERAAFLHEDAAALLPAWFRAECPALFASPELDVQLARAPLWLRLQTDDVAAVEAEFAANGWPLRPSGVLDSAWQVLTDADVTKTEAFARGAFEVQDLGSQCVLESVGLEPGGRWLDACAGAGGKTLQLARLLGTSGRVESHDVRPAALDELAVRVRRARVANVRVIREPAAPPYDGVLVDAPCSGSGTWRRSPHLKWTTSAQTLAERAELQQSILQHYAGLVRPGGRLVYATCSLAPTENAAVVRTFLSRNPAFAAVPVARTFGGQTSPEGVTFLPARHDTDGYFVASLRRAT